MKSLIVSKNRTYTSDIFVMLAIIVIGFGLRLVGIGVGLPDSPEPREVLIAENVLNLIHFTAPPDIYNWPGTAYFYLIALIGKGFTLAGINMTETRLIWLARFTNVLFSVATLWFTYRLGTRCYNKRVGQIASGFLAIAMLHATNESRFALVDIPATFCVTLFLYIAAREKSEINPATAIWLGIVAGIAFAVKFPTVFVCLSLLCFIRTENFYRRLATVIMVSALTFTLICPYWLIDVVSPAWNHFFEDFYYETLHYHRGHFGLFATADTGWARRFIYLWTLLKWGMGVPLALLVSLGVIWTLFKSARSLGKSSNGVRSMSITILFTDEKTRMGLLVTAFIIPYLLFIGAYKVTFTRHLLILYPALTILAAAMLNTFDKRIAITIGGAVAVYTFVYTAAYASVLLTQPTRVEAAEWISTNIPEQEAISGAPEILFDWLLPELHQDLTDEPAAWALIVVPDSEVFQKYARHPQKYQKQDWYPLRGIDVTRTLAFYERILGAESRYELHQTFRRTPYFLGIRIADRGAPFPMRALVHPEIQLYRRRD